MASFVPVWDVRAQDTLATRFQLRSRVTAWEFAQRLARQHGVRLIRVGRRLYVPVEDLERLGTGDRGGGVA